VKMVEKKLNLRKQSKKHKKPKKVVEAEQTVSDNQDESASAPVEEEPVPESTSAPVEEPKKEPSIMETVAKTVGLSTGTEEPAKTTGGKSKRRGGKGK